ncbi:hypothetical protein FOIG_12881 [Fusarium odoratissimum NRRL 54006]|uniref:Uncharacterized protein n=2 Tax=Fusarium oxysporum species complex TaxID=171631 RepID=X0IZK6_FUSO5|nr:uncharacterized protein FOIG_12881 [Fusarium odoratissimum NRRL 54006]EXL94322.1 hypothetical protein FOIG_12881 [Fusarium odoratissimum NRRL 54006]TXC12180.1 hypothetical protein FocTR4_00006975 [Fusarium oxysporum f. sp. cubense]
MGALRLGIASEAPHESTLAAGPRVPRFEWLRGSVSFRIVGFIFISLPLKALCVIVTHCFHHSVTPPSLDPPSLPYPSLLRWRLAFFPFFSNCPSHHQLRPSRPSRCRTMPPPMADIRRASRTATANNVFLFRKHGWMEILVSPCQGPISSDVPNSRVSIRKSHN